MGKHFLCAQISLESLMAFAIFLSMLALSLAGSMKIAESSNERLGYELGKQAFFEFSAKADAACALGSGNVRTVPLGKSTASLSSNGSEIFFSSGGFSSAFRSSCPVLLQAGPFSSWLRIENKGGTLEISASEQG